MQRQKVIKIFYVCVFVFTSAVCGAKTKVKLKDTKSRILVKKSSSAASEKSVASDVFFEIDPANTVVTLRLTHNLLGRFDTQATGGLSGRIRLSSDGTLAADTLEFRPASFASLISLRDEHLKNEYLEISKFPVVALKKLSTRLLQKKEGDKQGTLDFPLTGVLRVKTHEEPVEGKARVRLENDLLKGFAEFESKVSKFPVKTPLYKGVGVEDEFTIRVDVLAKPDLDEESVPSENASDI